MEVEVEEVEEGGGKFSLTGKSRIIKKNSFGNNYKRGKIDKDKKEWEGEIK